MVSRLCTMDSSGSSLSDLAESTWLKHCLTHDPRFDSHKYLYMSTTTQIKKVLLRYWQPWGQQVLHQRGISGIHCMQVIRHTSQRSTLALKLRADVARSPNGGISSPPKIAYVLQIFFKKSYECYTCRSYVTFLNVLLNTENIEKTGLRFETKAGK